MLLPVALAGCGSADSADSTVEPTPPLVEAVSSRYGSLPLTQRLSGVVRARNQVEIHPEISAVVTEVLVEDGQTVEKGQPLLRMRATEFVERLNQARANVRIARAQLERAEALAREARADLERTRTLATRDLGSRADLESAEARAASAEAEVSLAAARVEQADASAQEQEENLAQTVIRAPIAGTVGNREVEVGTFVGPGARVFTLGQLDEVHVDVVLTDRMLGFIEVGQRAEITLGGQVRSAPLSRISPFLHPVAHTTQAEIDVDNAEGLLKPGMFVKVDVFHGESEQATLVPLSALYENPNTGEVGVYVTEAEFPEAVVDESGTPRPTAPEEEVAFEFVPTQVIAEGRMEAAVRGVEPGTWVITLGQNLLGGKNAPARVRPVAWKRVERMQSLQREDLMREVIERRSDR